MRPRQRLIKTALARRGWMPLHADIEQVRDFESAYRYCQAYTLTSRERMYSVWGAVEHIERHRVEGDIVECGVWRGGSSMLAAIAATHFGHAERRLWLFDTFDGMPAPSTSDVDFRGNPVAERWADVKHKSENGVVAGTIARAPLSDVKANMASVGYPEGLIDYVEGLVEDTLPTTSVGDIALLRLDTDWYESTRLELELLWDRLQPNGVLIIDDYGHWQGARRAVEEFFQDRSDAPLLCRVDYTGRMAVKR